MQSNRAGNQLKKANTPKNDDSIFRAPKILRQPTSRNAVVGGRCALQIAADALPLPTYQWYHNGIAIKGANGPRFVIPKVRQGDAGRYHCEAKNIAGVVASRQVAVMIVQANLPDFVVEPKALTAKAGERVVFKLRFLGAVQPNIHQYDIQWYCNERKIRGAVKPELDIKRVPEQMGGEIVVKIALKTNANAYKVSDPAKLLVTSLKSAPTVEAADKALEVATRLIERPQATATPDPVQPAPTTASPTSADCFFSFDEDDDTRTVEMVLPLQGLVEAPQAAPSPQQIRAEKLKLLLAGIQKLRRSRLPARAS